MPALKPSKPYKRAEIQVLLGGEPQTYLPQKNKVILAGCFAVKHKNPGAPYEIQAGNAPKVAQKADLLANQKTISFPVFLRESEDSTDYYYVGEYKCVGQSKAKNVIAKAEAISGRTGELSCVLFLEAVGNVFAPGF